jgi:hypothetical protein
MSATSSGAPISQMRGLMIAVMPAAVVAFRDRVLQHAHKVVPWRNAVDIYKQLVTRKRFLQTIEKAPGIAYRHGDN